MPGKSNLCTHFCLMIFSLFHIINNGQPNMRGFTAKSPWKEALNWISGSCSLRKQVVSILNLEAAFSPLFITCSLTPGFISASCYSLQKNSRENFCFQNQGFRAGMSPCSLFCLLHDLLNWLMLSFHQATSVMLAALWSDIWSLASPRENEAVTGNQVLRQFPGFPDNNFSRFIFFH